MPRYLVTFIASASYSTYIEAESDDEAADQAYETAEFPYFPGGMRGDLDDWEVYDVYEMDEGGED